MYIHFTNVVNILYFTHVACLTWTPIFYAAIKKKPLWYANWCDKFRIQHFKWLWLAEGFLEALRTCSVRYGIFGECASYVAGILTTVNVICINVIPIDPLCYIIHRLAGCISGAEGNTVSVANVRCKNNRTSWNVHQRLRIHNDK